MPIAGTDFDRHVELACILPGCGFRTLGPTGREVPSKVYFDLATWHLINTVYAPARVAQLARMKPFYAKSMHHDRLMHGLAHEQVDALYVTGGSAGLKPLAQRIAARLPAASVVQGDRFASVAQGLGVHALQVFGAPGQDLRRHHQG